MTQTGSTGVAQSAWDVRDVADYLKVSVRTVWRLAKQPEFPKPIRLGGRVNRWRAEDLMAYLGHAQQAG
jgi:predicted DNA-binding transcriptional regulator AlpA